MRVLLLRKKIALEVNHLVVVAALDRNLNILRFACWNNKFGHDTSATLTDMLILWSGNILHLRKVWSFAQGVCAQTLWLLVMTLRCWSRRCG